MIAIAAAALPPKPRVSERAPDPTNPRTVEWVCANHANRVQHLFDNIDLERAGAGVRRAVEESDWPAACRQLLESHASLPGAPPRDPARPGRHDVRYADRILQDSVLVDWVWRALRRTESGGIDWDWRGAYDDPEWVWGLNRHAHLLWLMRAYLATGDTTYVRFLDAQLRDWILTSPYPDRKSNSARWRGLEVARRVEVWSELASRLTSPDEISPSTRILMMSSLVDHADYLRRFHAERTNWVVGEMTGLATIGVRWPEFRAAPQWVEYAARTMAQVLEDEVYPDGAYTELTSHYHHLVAISVQKFTDLLQGGARNGQLSGVDSGIDSLLTQRVENMWNYLALTMRPSGYGAQNNDSDVDATAGSLIEMAARYERPDWAFIARNGSADTNVAPPQVGPSVVLPWAGQVVLRSGWDRNAQWLFFDIGPWGTAHQHNDKLHVSVSAFGRDLLVDAGRYTYQRGKWRSYFAGSASHNVILVDGYGQRDDLPRASVPVSRDDYAIGDEFSFARGTFDAGYEWVQGRATHTRVVVAVTDAFWVVADRISTDRPRVIEALWHFHPDCTVAADGDGLVTTDEAQGNVRIVPVSTFPWEPATGSGSEDPVQGWYSAKMNWKQAGTVAIYRARIERTAVFAWVILPAHGEPPAVEAGVVGDGTDMISMTVAARGERWRIDIPFDRGAPRPERVQ